MLRRIPRTHLIPVGIFILVVLAGLSLQAPKAAAQPLAQEPIPHAIAGREDCLQCHKAGGVEPAPASHATYDNSMCQMCHKPAAAAEPTQVTAQPTTAPAQAPTAAPAASGPPNTPHTIEGREDCLLCHKTGGVKPVPANHATYDNSLCLACHKVVTAAQPTQAPTAQPTKAPAAQPTQAPSAQPTAAPAQAPTAAPAASGPPDTPHTIDGRQDCLLCHKAGGVQPVPASHTSYDNSMCLTCHKVAAVAQPTQAPATPGQPTATARPAQPGAPSLIPHPLEGRSQCSTCHGIAGLKPYPKDHVGRPDSGCLQCHVPASSPLAPTPVAGARLPAGVNTCLTCHKQTDLSMTLPSGEKLSLYVDGEQFANSVHGQQGLECTACHPNNTVYPHPEVTATTERELNRGIVEEQCATCHADIYSQYKDSVHGKALIEDDNLDVPSCTDCHGVHNISNPTTSLFRLHSPDLCSSCHADSALMSKYGISSNVEKTYLSDFHGTTVRLQADRNNPNITSYKAVCYDCHGIHDIKMVDDPNSTVIKDNLVKTCQKCHPNADTNFPAAWTSHYVPNVNKWPLVYFVNLFYSILIPATVGGMVLFIGADVTRNVVNKRKSRRSK